MSGGILWSYSQGIEDALWRAAADVLPAELLGTSRLVQAIRTTSDLYTMRRDDIQSAHEFVAARALFFSLCDVPKVKVPLAELANAAVFPSGDLRVVDFGCGVGTMSLGLLDFVEQSGRSEGNCDGGGARKISIVGCDRDATSLEIFRGTLDYLRPSLNASVALSTHATAVDALPIDSADLIFLGSVLNELSAVARKQLVKRCLRSLRGEGAVIVVEPALRETSRALHLLRDELVADGSGHVFAPCTRGQQGCPALVDPKDWCHEDRACSYPPRTSELIRLTGLRTHGAKFSYLVLRREATDQLDLPPGKQLLRVVSRVQKRKGEWGCHVCGERARGRLRLQKRAKSAANRDFPKLRRGDIVVVDDDVTTEISASTDVKRYSVDDAS